jgi:tetratricopeptide (TPR) repeat protein/AraC-like DNA-binding protein
MTEPLSPDQIFIRKLTEIIQANLQNENFGVNDLARESGMSLYKINRKLYVLKKIRVSQFIREVRLTRAIQLLKNGTFTAAEVSYKVGFGSPAYFNKCFREFFGCTPGDIKKTDLNGNASDIIYRIESDEYIKQNNLKRRYIFPLPGIPILIIILGIAGYMIYSVLHENELTGGLISSDGRISLVVMPFRNMTGDTTLNEWQEIIQQGVISSLSNIKELLIRHQESVNSLLPSGEQAAYSSISPDIAGKISRKLISTLFIYGSIEKAGNELRVDAQLIDTRTKEVLKSFNIERPAGDGDFFQVIDTISKKMANYLLISRMIKENPEWGRFPISTNSPEALRYSINGSKAREKKDFAGAVFWYSKSLEADSNFIDAAFGLENAYAYSGNMDGSRKLLIKNYNRRDRMSTLNQIYASWAYSLTFEAPEENIKYLKQLQLMDDQWPKPSFELGVIYNMTGQYYNAITEFQKTFNLYKRWGIEFRNNSAWVGLGIAYHKTGQYDKERKLYRKALKYFPEEPLIFFRLVLLSYSEKDTVEASRYEEKFLTALRKRGYSEAHQSKRLGDIYTEAGLTDKAEKFYRQALSLEPSNIDRIKTLASFFTDNNRNLEEALSLIEKAIGTTSSPYSYYELMDMKGRCLLKQGRKREALEILEKTYTSTPYKVWFIYSDLIKAREAVANLK